uniref:ATP-binding cassette transporter subfamily B member 1-like protein X3 n=1 Tax=Brachionus rotundiformis TaxID=96890 RepID=A0A7H9SMK6_9BILA|nr:ATP-binding cassette transporter subfamily B member 1-like protein X3 [Brachionus rotundiformis]
MKQHETDLTHEMGIPGQFKTINLNDDPPFDPFLNDNFDKKEQIELEDIKIKKKSKKKKSKEEKVSIRKLFKFATCLDYLLIVIGTLSAAGSSVVFPLIFLLYGQIVGVFVDINASGSNTTVAQTPKTVTSPYGVECLSSNPDNESSSARIEDAIYLYVGFGFLSLVLNYIAHVCWNTAGEKQIKKMREALYKTIIRQDMAFFDKNLSGDLNSALTSNIDTVKFGIGFKVSDFIHLVCRGIACLIFALVQAWMFSIVFIALIPFMILSTALMVLVTRKYTIEEFKAYGRAGSIAQEALSSIRTLLSLGLQKQNVVDYEKNLDNANKMAQKKGLFSGFFLGLTDFLIDIFFGIGVFYGVYLARYQCDKFLPGNILQSFFCIFIATFSVGQALPYVKELAEARGAAKKIFDIIDTKSAIDVFEQKDGLQLNSLKGDIEFDNVSFSYPQRKEVKVLKGLSFKIPAGKTVALVGSSGGGKSTVVSLLQRFYLPESGLIKIDGYPVDTLDLNWLRSQSALVSQEPILFTNTIKENIRLGCLDATDEEIEQAAKKANAHDFILTTTNKYETQVGERGAQLSGGQKQRIAIARALIRNPKILLLDEATSALDYESEKIVQDALDKAKIGRTTIIIAHRLSTIRNADLIIFISNGKVMEKGTHEELMEIKGEYYNLVQTQNKTKEEIHVHAHKHGDHLKDSLDSSSSESESDSESEYEKKSLEIDLVENEADKLSKKKYYPFYFEIRLFKLHAPDWFWLLFGSIGQAISAIIQPATALVFAEIFNLFTLTDAEKQRNESLKYMGIIFGFGFAAIISNIIHSYSFALAGSRLTQRIRTLMFKSMLRQEIGFHDLDENRSSVLATQLSSSAAFVKGKSSDKLKLYVQGLAGVGFSIIYSFVLSWKLALVMLIFVPINFISGVMVGRSSMSQKVKGKNANEEVGRITIETVENIKTIVSLGREQHFISEFNLVYGRKFRKSLLLLHVQAIFYSISISIVFFIQATAFSFGFELVSNNELSVPDLFRIFPIMTFSALILARSYSLLPDQNLASSAAKTAFKIIERKSQIDNFSEEGLKPEKVVGNIKFENVHFRYPNRPQVKVLNGFNLEIKNGTTNALVGTSGCGKSTTIALLLRFYDVEDGVVYLDGIDIRQLNINWLRSQIGLVSQEPVLFNVSIYENISMGDINREKIEINEVIDAAINSNIHSKIESLPEKYNTLVGSKGGQLSGGEKQRVAIARALIRRPKILLLDEATSALDNQSETVVQDALDKAQVGRTCIVIAHRLSTIENSTKISVVKDGVILEEGSHSTLMKKKDFYFKLQAQSKKNSLNN